MSMEDGAHWSADDSRVWTPREKLTYWAGYDSGRAFEMAANDALAKLIEAAKTPLKPLGGDGVDRCRICYAAINAKLPVHAAGCALAEVLKEAGDPFTLEERDFDDLR